MLDDELSRLVFSRHFSNLDKAQKLAEGSSSEAGVCRRSAWKVLAPHKAKPHESIIWWPTASLAARFPVLQVQIKQEEVPILLTSFH